MHGRSLSIRFVIWFAFCKIPLILRWCVRGWTSHASNLDCNGQTSMMMNVFVTHLEWDDFYTYKGESVVYVIDLRNGRVSFSVYDHGYRGWRTFFLFNALQNVSRYPMEELDFEKFSEDRFPCSPCSWISNMFLNISVKNVSIFTSDRTHVHRWTFSKLKVVKQLIAIKKLYKLDREKSSSTCSYTRRSCKLHFIPYPQKIRIHCNTSFYLLVISPTTPGPSHCARRDFQFLIIPLIFLFHHSTRTERESYTSRS